MSSETEEVRSEVRVKFTEVMEVVLSKEPGSLDALYAFASVSNEKLELLQTMARTEDWGPLPSANMTRQEDSGVGLFRAYVAAWVYRSLITKSFTHGRNGAICMTAGNLTTRDGDPLYMLWIPNARYQTTKDLPYCLGYVGPKPNMTTPLPGPAPLPTWHGIGHTLDLRINQQHVFGDNGHRIDLDTSNKVTIVCALTGALYWALQQELYTKGLFHDAPSFLVPLYVKSQDDTTMPPDLVAAVNCDGKTARVATVLLPHMAYSSARYVVLRHDALPAWVLSSWRARPRAQAGA